MEQQMSSCSVRIYHFQSPKHTSIIAGKISILAQSLSQLKRVYLVAIISAYNNALEIIK
jgi:hypothetical protein